MTKTERDSATYAVYVANARNADVVSHPVEPVVVTGLTLPEAIAELARWHIDGPNGPARSARLLDAHGRCLDPWDEIRRQHLEPLVCTDYAGRERLVGCR